MATGKNEYLNTVNGLSTASHDNGAGEPITDTGSSVVTIKLQDVTTTASAGSPFTVRNFKTLNIKATGTATSFVIVFEAAHEDNVYEQIQAMRYKDYEFTNELREKNVSVQVDVTGYHKFQARVVSVAGGNVTVSGKAVS